MLFERHGPKACSAVFMPPASSSKDTKGWFQGIVTRSSALSSSSTGAKQLESSFLSDLDIGRGRRRQSACFDGWQQPEPTHIPG